MVNLYLKLAAAISGMQQPSCRNVLDMLHSYTGGSEPVPCHGQCVTNT